VFADGKAAIEARDPASPGTKKLPGWGLRPQTPNKCGFAEGLAFARR
jgi:hypothetical protein